LYHPGLDETYHSKRGAIQESQHVFIENGLSNYLNQHQQKDIRVLEYGFGTGLNTLLTLKSRTKRTVFYETIEKYPLSLDLVNQLNYGRILGQQQEFTKIHTTKWGIAVDIKEGFTLKKVKADFREYQNSSTFDIIYFDAFAPSRQPELWQLEILQQCYNLLVPNGILVTYSAKGQFKRDLKSIGFEIESPPGPPGKFEITRATKVDI
jgi:tRNA U34 5-methylaminomethyl-2-thiouridine-forming methyltransferase MnmC